MAREMKDRLAITFVVQNETHAQNFGPIVDSLKDKGIPADLIEVIHLDHVTGLNTKNEHLKQHLKLFQPGVSISFYLMSYFERAKWLIKNSCLIAESVRNTGVFIMGNDGAIQRRMALMVKKNGGKVILLLDGILTPWEKGLPTLTNDLKRLVQKSMGKLNLEHFAPSHAGHYHTDVTYVMDPVVKTILENQGVKNRIEAITLPRISMALKSYNQIKAKKNSSKVRVLYATGAYLWHGLVREHKMQLQDLFDFKKFAQENPEWLFRIRVHPRENKGFYLQEDWPDNLEITSNETIQSFEDLAWSTILVTARSTMAREAKIVNLPVAIYSKNFPPLPKNGVLNDPYYKEIRNLSELRNLYHDEHMNVDLDKTQTDSIDLIASHIVSFLY